MVIKPSSRDPEAALRASGASGAERGAPTFQKLYEEFQSRFMLNKIDCDNGTLIHAKQSKLYASSEVILQTLCSLRVCHKSTHTLEIEGWEHLLVVTFVFMLYK